MFAKAIVVIPALILNLSSVWGQALPQPPGPYCPLTPADASATTSFRSGDRLIATYYFYWYKWKDACAGPVCNPVYTKSHIRFASGAVAPSARDALTDHPDNLERMDFSDPDWHLGEIQQIVESGIDVILPVFWGVPGRYGDDGHYVARWSTEGLKALIEALSSLESQGKPVPKVGMFFDTTTLIYESPFHYKQGERDLDLKTEPGKKHFYATIRDFFSLVPPRFWALWEGHPLVWLYSSAFAGDYDGSLLPYCRTRFSADFGGLVPWFVANLDWQPQLRPDWVYRWGGAIRPTFLSVASIGPGFDNSGAFGLPRGSRVQRDREEGRFYSRSWERALRSQAPLVVIETWNELHEGTEICPTKEYGDRYVQLTRDYAMRFKERSNLPLPGPFQNFKGVSWQTGSRVLKGIEPVHVEDGTFEMVRSGTETVLEARAPYLYFSVDDSFCFSSTRTANFDLVVEYFDLPARVGEIRVEYDSWDWNSTLYGIYRSTDKIPLTGSFSWRKHRFEIQNARFANNQNEGADFRLVLPRGLRIRSVELSKSK